MSLQRIHLSKEHSPGAARLIGSAGKKFEVVTTCDELSSFEIEGGKLFPCVGTDICWWQGLRRKTDAILNDGTYIQVDSENLIEVFRGRQSIWTGLDVLVAPDDAVTDTVHMYWQFIESQYEVVAPAKVLSFLETQPDLCQLLMDTPKKLKSFFENTTIKLQKIQDYDVEGVALLSIDVLTSLPPEEAIELMDRFDDEWWLDNMRDAKGKININIDYI